MYFLDANALYWYFGREKLGLPTSISSIEQNAYRTALDKIQNKAIPSSVFMEFVVHFRNQPEHIREVTQFLKSRNIRLYNNFVFWSIGSDEFMCYFTDNDEGIEQRADALLQTKIDIEARFTLIFLKSVFLVYLDRYIETTSQDINKTDAVKHIVYKLYRLDNTDNQKTLNEFKGALREGYSNGDEIQTLKEKYIERLSEECSIYRGIVVAVREFAQEGEKLYEKMKEEIDSIREQFMSQQVMQHIKNRVEFDQAFLAIAYKKIPEIFENNGLTHHQSLYLSEMLSAWLDRGQKLRKNDIMDMFCFGVLDSDVKSSDDDELVLISFDDAMRNFLAKHNPNSEHIISSYFINN